MFHCIFFILDSTIYAPFNQPEQQIQIPFHIGIFQFLEM
jgi:hypothetical protein